MSGGAGAGRWRDVSVLTLCPSVPARWRLQPVDQSAVEGQAVSFHCQVGGVPAPSVTWTIQSGETGDRRQETGDRRQEASVHLTFLFPGRQKSTYTVTGLGGRTEDLQIIGNGTLVIWRVALSDQGEYTCAASNDVGDSISKTVNLKINGKMANC